GLIHKKEAMFTKSPPEREAIVYLFPPYLSKCFLEAFEQSELRSQYKREQSDGLIHKKEAMFTKSPPEREAIVYLFPPYSSKCFLEAFEQSELRSQYKRERSDGLIHKKEAMFSKSHLKEKP
ncbi:hypothetical protein, partial [Listeria booriae]|uniref:hypothetical protein n=1 Tax=Listeria booriae TaxID=1552123 RepID=UPI00162803CA